MSRRQQGLTKNQHQRPKVKTLDTHMLTSNSPDTHLQHRVFSTLHQIDFVVRRANSWRHANHVHFWRKERDKKLHHWRVGDPNQACQYKQCDGRLTLMALSSVRSCSIYSRNVRAGIGKFAVLSVLCQDYFQKRSWHDKLRYWNTRCQSAAVWVAQNAALV